MFGHISRRREMRAGWNRAQILALLKLRLPSRTSQRMLAGVVLLSATTVGVGGCAAEFKALRNPTIESSIEGNLGRQPIPVKARDHFEDLAIVLSLSGGGIRAGNLGVGVLLALESLSLDPTEPDGPNLLGHLQSASTVSGGGLAIALMNALQSSACPHPDSLYTAILQDQSIGARKLDMLTTSWVGAILRSANLSALRGDVTAANLLEKDYFRVLTNLPCDSGRMVTLADAQDEGAVFHVPNATISGTGRVFAFTESDLALLRVEGYFDSSTLRWEPLPEAYRTKALPYSVAIGASAAFPPVLPDTRLLARPDATGGAEVYLHLTDGGQADDNGLATAVRLLRGRSHNSKVIYLAVDALPSAGHPYSEDEKPTSRPGLLWRSLDLPRYGSKRELPNIVYMDPDQRRRSVLDLDRSIYVAHAGLWLLPDPPSGTKTAARPHAAKIGTLEAGITGISRDEQLEMITAGMQLTYRALLGLQYQEIIQELGELIRASASCLVANRSEPSCMREESWSQLGVRLGSMRTAVRVKNTIVGGAGIVEFARSEKLVRWSTTASEALEGVESIRFRYDDAGRRAYEALAVAASTAIATFSAAAERERLKRAATVGDLRTKLQDTVEEYSKKAHQVVVRHQDDLDDIGRAQALVRDLEGFLRNHDGDPDEREACHCQEPKCLSMPRDAVLLRSGIGECIWLQDVLPRSQSRWSGVKRVVRKLRDLVFGNDIAELATNLAEYYAG